MTRGNLIASTAALLALAQSGQALAQRAGDNAVSGSEDAFGAMVGLEKVGIYTDADTRGFSPLDAGNARIEGIYYDPVGIFVLPLRESTTIRVGTAAEGFPFHAPTGIVDYQYKPFPREYGHTGEFQYGAYDGFIAHWDLRLPLVQDKVGLTGGFAYGNVQSGDGSYNRSLGSAIRPMFKLGGVEIAPFYARADFFKDFAHILAVPTGADLPELPRKRRWLGQSWAKGKWRDVHAGTTVKARLTDSLSLRAGLFRSVEVRTRNYSDIFYVTGPDNSAQHQLIADPRRQKSSLSGEALLALRRGEGRWDHRFFAGYRSRDRRTETGGSDVFDFGPVRLGDLDPQPRPDFDFGAVSVGRLRQSSLMLGYIGSLKGLGQINLGLQKARYRARFRDALSGQVDRTRANPWLYNATVTVEMTPSLSAYAGTQRGLEDRGVAPDRALNRSEQLPATLARQYEGGLRWKFGRGQLVLNGFEITKPYFSYDAGRRFIELGHERHLGAEASLSGQFNRLSVLAGIVAMKREVNGAAVDARIIGKLPTGTPGLRGRIDINYQTALLGGLTPTLTVIHLGRRAVGSRPQAALGGHQLMLPAQTTLDLGLRHKVTIGGVPASIRAVVENVFDKAAWKVVAADTLFPDERRRFSLFVTADF